MPALVLFVLATNVYGLSTLSTTVPKWIGIYLLACWAMGAFALWSWRRPSIVLDRVDAAALALFGYTALSCLWSADKLQGVYSLTNASALFIVFLWARHSRDALRIPAAAGFALALAFLCALLAPWDNGGDGNRGFLAEKLMALIALSFAVHEHGARTSALLCALLPVAYLLLESQSKVQLLAGAVVLIALGIRWIGNRRSRIRFSRGANSGSTASSHG